DIDPDGPLQERAKRVSRDSEEKNMLRRSLYKMNRCECHDVSFSEVLRFSRITGIEDFETLTEKTGCGHTCTACHCDLKEALAEQNAQERELVPVLVHPRQEDRY